MGATEVRHRSDHQGLSFLGLLGAVLVFCLVFLGALISVVEATAYLIKHRPEAEVAHGTRE